MGHTKITSQGKCLPETDSYHPDLQDTPAPTRPMIPRREQSQPGRHHHSQGQTWTHRRGPCAETGTHILVPAAPGGLSAPTGVGRPAWAWKCPWIWTGSEKKLVSQSWPTLYNPRNCSPPGSSVHGILQARVLERAATSFSRGFSWSRGWVWVFCLAGSFFTVWVTRQAQFGQGGNPIHKGPPT